MLNKIELQTVTADNNDFNLTVAVDNLLVAIEDELKDIYRDNYHDCIYTEIDEIRINYFEGSVLDYSVQVTFGICSDDEVEFELTKTIKFSNLYSVDYFRGVFHGLNDSSIVVE